MRKYTKRTAWVPVNPIAHAMFQAGKLSAEEWNKQIIPLQVALDQLLTGNWDKVGVWDCFFYALNRIESLTKLNHVPDGGFIERAQGVFMDALDREDRTGAKAFKHDELAVMRELLQTYGDLLKEVSRRQFAEACRHTDANVNRIIRAKKGVTNINHCILETA